MSDDAALAAAKAVLRAQVRAARRSVSPAALAAAASQICQNLEALVGPAARLGVFAPLSHELPVAQAWIARTGAPGGLVWPKVVDAAAHRMIFVAHDGVPVARGAFGIAEPDGNTPAAVSACDAIVVPGLAFSRRGERLGTGGGFFDRFFAETGNLPRLVGVCLDTELLDCLPAGDFDVLVDWILTPERTIDARHSRRADGASRC